MFRRLACFALLVPLALAACGKKGEEHEGLSDTKGATHVAVTISDKGCSPSAITVKAGKVAFDVTNDGSASVTEFYVLEKKDDSIVGEVENVIPGKDKTLTLKLDEGSYLTKCPNGDPEKGTLTVTAS